MTPIEQAWEKLMGQRPPPDLMTPDKIRDLIHHEDFHPDTLGDLFTKCIEEIVCNPTIRFGATVS